MTYEQYGRIQATDINTGLIGPMEAAKRLNALWGRGYGSRGYGQSPILPDINIGDPILASDWQNMNNLAQKIANHENKIIVPDDFFRPGYRVNFNQGLTKQIIEQVDASRTSSQWQSNYILSSLTNDFGWFNKLTYTMTATFPTGDDARYFFNCGGQFAVRVFQPGSSSSNPIRAQMAKLASDIGTLYWSIVPGGGASTKIAGVNYTATTKIGGAGQGFPNTESDYYTSSVYSSAGTFTTLFQQFVSNGVPGYDQSFIQLDAHTKGDKGSYGANGNIIVMRLTIDVAPNTASMPGGGIVYFYTIPPLADPSRSWLSQQSWSIPTISITSVAT